MAILPIHAMQRDQWLVWLHWKWVTTVKIGQQPCCDQRFSQRLNTKYHQLLGNNIWCQSDCIGGSRNLTQKDCNHSQTHWWKFANNCHRVYKWRQIAIILQSIGLRCVSLQLEVDFRSCHLVVFCTSVLLQLNCHPAEITSLFVEELLNICFLICEVLTGLWM